MRNQSQAETLSHSVEAEQSVIGAIIRDNSAFDRIGSLHTEDFYVSDHRTIFTVAAQLSCANRAFDLITLHEALKAAGKAEMVGGLAYLNALEQNTPSAANVARYAEIVRSHADRRAFVKALDEASAAVTNGAGLVETIEQAQGAMMALTERRQIREPKLIAEFLTQNVEQIDARYHGNDGPSGIRTGFPRLDDKIKGMRPGEIYIAAGRPGTGKTALAMQISYNVATDEKAAGAVLFLSMEMEAPELSERALALSGGVPFDNIVTGKMTADDWPRLTYGVQQLSNARLLIDDSPSLTLRDVRSKAMAVKRKHGLSLVVIDYLQLMRGTGENRTQEIGSISRGLKALAKELKTPFLTLSQLSRKCEERPNKRPIISDLRESGDIEQDADGVLLLFRPVKYDETFQPADLMEVNVAKKRNGREGTVPLSYQGDFMRVGNFEGRWPLPEMSRRLSMKPSLLRDGGLD
jgi:replicative DNA helicase